MPKGKMCNQPLICKGRHRRTIGEAELRVLNKSYKDALKSRVTLHPV